MSSGEKSLQHEYWIRPDGVVMPDVEQDHADMATEYLIARLYEYRENDWMLDRLLAAAGSNTWGCDSIAFRQALLNAADNLSRDADEYAELAEDYKPCMLRAGVPQTLLAAVFDVNADPREWVVRHAQWICVKNERITVPARTDTVARTLRDGLWDILRYEKLPAFANDFVFSLYDFPGATVYRATWVDINEGVAAAWQPCGACRREIVAW